MHAQVPRGVALYYLWGNTFYKLFIQVKSDMPELNGTSMFNVALEKLEYLQQDITHEFGTSLGKTWQKIFLGQWCSEMSCLL